MWGGGGSKMATQAVPPSPSWRNYPQNRWNCRFWPRGWGCGWRQVFANGPRSVRQVHVKESRDQCGAGWENVISSNTLQLMVSSRNLFYKTGVQKPSSTLLQCQSLPTSFLRAVRSEYPADIVLAFICKWGGGGRLFVFSWCCYILQATSLIVNNKNKASHNNTCGTVSWKVLLHTVYEFNIFNVDWG